MHLPALLRLLPVAAFLLAPLLAQTPATAPDQPAPPPLPATERKAPEESKKTYLWLDRAPLGQPVQTAPAGARLLWYRQPAQEWTEALPLGSGRLGAMIFGGIADERHQLNVDSLWDGAPLNADNPKALENLPEIRRLLFTGENKKASDLAGQTMLGQPKGIKPYQTLGELYLEAPGLSGATAYTRSLDLDTATAAVRYTSEGVSYTRESFASAPDE
jgi:alpha-L-fucosidase 2